MWAGMEGNKTTTMGTFFVSIHLNSDGYLNLLHQHVNDLSKYKQKCFSQRNEIPPRVLLLGLSDQIITSNQILIDI